MPGALLDSPRYQQGRGIKRVCPAGRYALSDLPQEQVSFAFGL